MISKTLRALFGAGLIFAINFSVSAQTTSHSTTPDSPTLFAGACDPQLVNVIAESFSLGRIARDATKAKVSAADLQMTCDTSGATTSFVTKEYSAGVSVYISEFWNGGAVLGFVDSGSIPITIFPAPRLTLEEMGTSYKYLSQRLPNISLEQRSTLHRHLRTNTPVTFLATLTREASSVN